MNNEALTAQLIESEITNAVLASGGDLANEKLRDAIRREAIVIESADGVTVAARLEGNTPKLSNRTPASDALTPMSLSELAEEIRDEGKLKSAFPAKDQPAPKPNSNGLIDGLWTWEEYLKLSHAEKVAIGRRLDPDGRKKKPETPHPGMNTALKALMANDKADKK